MHCLITNRWIVHRKLHHRSAVSLAIPQCLNRKQGWMLLIFLVTYPGKIHKRNLLVIFLIVVANTYINVFEMRIDTGWVTAIWEINFKPPN